MCERDVLTQIPTRSAPIPSWALRAGVRHRDHRTRWPVANAAVVQPIVGTRSTGAVEAMGAPTLGMLHVHVCVVCVLSEEISYIRDTSMPRTSTCPGTSTRPSLPSTHFMASSACLPETS